MPEPPADEPVIDLSYHRSGLPLVFPVELPDRLHVYHLYVVRTAARDALRAALDADGIETGVHYPIPLHLQPALKFLGHREGDFPIAEELARTSVSLPLHPYLDAAAQARVADAIRRFFSRAKAAPTR